MSAFVEPRHAHTHAKRQEARTGEPQSIVAVKAKVDEGGQIKDWHSDLTLHDGNRWWDDLGPVKKTGGVKPDDIEDVIHLRKR